MEPTYPWAHIWIGMHVGQYRDLGNYIGLPSIRVWRIHEDGGRGEGDMGRRKMGRRRQREDWVFIKSGKNEGCLIVYLSSKYRRFIQQPRCGHQLFQCLHGGVYDDEGAMMTRVFFLTVFSFSWPILGRAVWLLNNHVWRQTIFRHFGVIKWIHSTSVCVGIWGKQEISIGWPPSMRTARAIC